MIDTYELFKKSANSFGPIFEQIIDDSYKYKLRPVSDRLLEVVHGNNVYQVKYFGIGEYDKENEEFVWFGLKKMFEEMVFGKNLDEFLGKSREFMGKFFADKIKMSYDDHLHIPYFMGLLYNDNLIWFETQDNKIIYIMAKLKMKIHISNNDIANAFAEYRKEAN